MEITENFRLTHSWDMILCLEDFINCINLHKSSLKSPRNIGFMNFMKLFYGQNEFNPAGILKDYIYLEANSFFQYAKKLIKKGRKMPELPIYLEDLRIFRNRVVAHKDDEERLKSDGEWINEQQKIAKLIPIQKLIGDVKKYYSKIDSSAPTK